MNEQNMDIRRRQYILYFDQKQKGEWITVMQIQPNQKYGFLTTIAKTEERKKEYVVWKCQCDCGNTTFVTSRQLVRNAHISCGCKKADAKNGSHAENLTGKVFGKLTVLYRTANRNGRNCWLCQCSCGRQKEVTAHDLKSGKVKSCGCLPNIAVKPLTLVMGI